MIRIEQVHIKDVIEINGKSQFVWSLMIRSDGVIKAKLLNGKLIQIQ